MLITKKTEFAEFDGDNYIEAAMWCYGFFYLFSVAHSELDDIIWILCDQVSRSPVFRAMLENDMEERRSGTIKISDVSYDALRAFVNYLYTAEASLNDQMACDLLVLAEKYQVKHLKACCERFLIARLNWDKAVANYVFAYQHNAKQLLDAALALITDNMDKLSEHEEYVDLVESNPRIVVEIYEAYLKKQVNTAACKDSPTKK